MSAIGKPKILNQRPTLGALAVIACSLLTPPIVRDLPNDDTLGAAYSARLTRALEAVALRQFASCAVGATWP
ncbi:MAG TPA: hypothetical protein VFG14_10665 [Chthoniobacteraceae bacterium]|nr:hypothetical protein [Chthoniobacteraceae bacterium]